MACWTYDTTPTEYQYTGQLLQPYIQQAIDKGTVNQITTTAQRNPVFQYEATINGQVVIVRAVTLANGVIQVTDSWVKTK